MRYLSTRGRAPVRSFSEILLEGLASDGGLYVPESYPSFSRHQLAEMAKMPYAELALALLSRFAPEIPEADWARMLLATYHAGRYPYARHSIRSARVSPLTWLVPERFGILELSNGPTLAFKDMAMQLLGELFEYQLAKENRFLNILGATSGDTGSAAEYAMRGRHRIRVFMLSPAGRMSPFQRAQMYHLLDDNIHNLAVRGSFDDAQDIVKALGADQAFKAQYQLGAVNSINWARIAAQVVYYFAGYFQAVDRIGDPVSFAVPSGNFGNILAGHIARMMGLPIAQLILATNENDVLDEFFRTGVYRPRRSEETRVTSSPSMDISKASNFERFLFDVVDRDAAVLNALWEELASTGAFDLKQTRFWQTIGRFGFVSGRNNHHGRVATIRSVWDQHRVLIDPHTADGVRVARQVADPRFPVIVLETAQPVKFAETIVEAVGFQPPRPEAFVNLEQAPQRVVELPAELSAVRAYLENHALRLPGAAELLNDT